MFSKKTKHAVPCCSHGFDKAAVNLKNVVRFVISVFILTVFDYLSHNCEFISSYHSILIATIYLTIVTISCY